jgi:hypothetical protein
MEGHRPKYRFILLSLGLKPQQVQDNPEILYKLLFEIITSFLKYRPPKFVNIPRIDHSDDGFRNSSVSSSTCDTDQEYSRSMGNVLRADIPEVPENSSQQTEKPS